MSSPTPSLQNKAFCFKRMKASQQFVIKKVTLGLLVVSALYFKALVCLHKAESKHTRTCGSQLYIIPIEFHPHTRTHAHAAEIIWLAAV